MGFAGLLQAPVVGLGQAAFNWTMYVEIQN